MLIAFGVVVAITVASAATALADDAPPATPTPQSYLEAIETAPSLGSLESQLTDSQAAEELPHRDLGREEALELLEATFGEQLKAPAGIFGDLQVERFLSNHVAVIAPGEHPEQTGVVLGDEQQDESLPTLLGSTLPLRAPDLLGREEPVDLGLEREEGDILPANPLTEVEIPAQLGEGIELPESGVRIELAGAPEERAPSIAEGSAAVYPNVAENTDFAVAPTPTGVETFTQIRSAEAPQTETLELDLPEGAEAAADGEGGAAITKDGETLVEILPASAIDAAGQDVPVSFDLDANSLSYTVDLGPDAQYPILLDPLVQEYTWGNGWYQGIEEWKGAKSASYPFAYSTKAECSTWCAGYLENNKPGLWVMAQATWPDEPGWSAGFTYSVPRWESDWKAFNEGPKSFISHITYYGWMFQHRTDANDSPYALAGLWYPEGAHWNASAVIHGYENTSLTQPATNLSGGSGVNSSKQAVLALVSSDTHHLTANRDTYVGWLTLELSDEDHPSPKEPTTTAGWVNTTPSSPIEFQFKERGLGVYSVTVSDKSGHSWKTLEGCTGIPSNPCPRAWNATTAGQPQLTYDPSVMSTGIDEVELLASDPIGQTNKTVTNENKTAEPLIDRIKVDHTKPTLEPLTGTITEQSTLGTMLSTYKVKYLAKDGTEAAPQSGAAAIEIKVDGTKAFSTAPGCSTKNCELSGEWTLEASKYANGEHTLEVIAKDGVGLESEARKQKFTIAHDESAPQLAFSGTATEQGSLGSTLPRYGFTLKATDLVGTYHSGVVSETVKVDGKTIDSYGPGCGAAGSCSIERALTLVATEYAVGLHTLEATATDAAGNKATKILSFRFDPDTTAPLITLSNALAEAPEGWVEQHNYLLTATATDAGGYGAKQIVIDIDGQQVFKTTALSCEWGSCQRTKTWTIEAAAYTGGAHELQVIASDNAGNQRTKTMTMNVDPDGNVSAEESTETMEAVAETSSANPVGASVQEEGYDGTAPGLTLEEGTEGVEAGGTVTPVTISEEGPCEIEMQVLPEEALEAEPESESVSSVLEEEAPAAEEAPSEIAAVPTETVALEPEGEPLDVGPEASASSPCEPTIVNESAAVEPNTGPEADTITRPLYDGTMIFEAIRGPEAPEEYSWEFNLGEEQELKLIDEDTAGIYWSNGTLAMTIAATVATDAAEVPVPTSLSVSEGNVVTLTVHYKAGNNGQPFTYPILAGSAIRVGYEELTVTSPEGIQEEEEAREDEEGTVVQSVVVGPPVDIS